MTDLMGNIWIRGQERASSNRGMVIKGIMFMLMLKEKVRKKGDGPDLAESGDRSPVPQGTGLSMGVYILQFSPCPFSSVPELSPELSL